ncbi:MAG: hypothetical protein GX892_07555, partial [Thermoanaerobacteraceae bacterium]|nr:hypothetical protein [Thermoanaerobacteraceae bacterium]
MKKRVVFSILVFTLIISMLTACTKPADNESAIQEETSKESYQEAEEF